MYSVHVLAFIGAKKIRGKYKKVGLKNEEVSRRGEKRRSVSRLENFCLFFSFFSRAGSVKGEQECVIRSRMDQFVDAEEACYLPVETASKGKTLAVSQWKNCAVSFVRSFVRSGWLRALNASWVTLI